MQIKQNIPNTITLLNLSSGLLAIIAIFKGYYDEAFLFVKTKKPNIQPNIHFENQLRKLEF
jgi:hypothetical protein